MALLDVYPTWWVRCRAHGTIFPAFDPIWSLQDHMNCALDNLDRWWPVVIINDADYDPTDRETQRVLSCSECSGKGLVMAVDVVASETWPKDGFFVVLDCERCKGWGHV